MATISEEPFFFKADFIYSLSDGMQKSGTCWFKLRRATGEKASVWRLLAWCCGARATLKFVILLPWLPECRGYRLLPSLLTNKTILRKTLYLVQIWFLFNCFLLRHFLLCFSLRLWRPFCLRIYMYIQHVPLTSTPSHPFPSLPVDPSLFPPNFSASA